MSIGIGILGFAHGHVGAYCAQWKQFPADRVRLIAGWDHDITRAANAVSSLNVAVDPTVQALLSRREIDAVVIGAETSRHAELVERAAAAGKAIVLQKPLALTLDEGKRIVAAVRRHGVRFSMAWQMRVDPQNLKMREILRDGTLGRIYMMRRRHGLNTHLWPGFENSWHVKPELNRGMWADDAAHAIDFIYWMLGMPTSVIAEVATLRSPKVPDDNGIAIFRFADGAFAEVVSSFVCVAGENTTEITGEKGVIVQNYGDAVSCNVPRPDGMAGLKWYLQERGCWTNSDIASPPSHAARIAGLAAPILEFLENRSEPIGTAGEALDVLRLTLASYRSTELGRRVSMNELP